ncbi:MAG: thiamine phosphate synthase, partial [Acidimicrobiales bacterium]|nr:thiamine phosphate synthase [Acidimicrobiales bacterium]
MTPPVGSDAVAGASAAPAMPRLLVLTDRTLVPPGSSLVDTVAAAVAGGARGVVLREKDLPRAERAALAAQLAAVLAPVAGV